MLIISRPGLLKKLTFIILILFFGINAPFNASFGAGFDNSAQRLEYVNIDWWKRFNDALLIEYIIRGINNNYSQQALELKLSELYQAKNIEISKEFPSLNVGANYLGLKIPKTAIPFQGFRDNAFALPFIVNWEIDLFGKQKNKIDIKKEDFKAAYYDEKAAAIALAAEIGTNYFNILNLDEQIKIQNRIINNRKEILRRAKNRYAAGVLGMENLNDINKMYEYEKVVLNDYKKQREKFLLNLKYLLGPDGKSGQNPDGDLIFGNISEAKYLGKIPDFIESNVTIERPDILKKEADLKKAKIDVTLARKEFLPNINVFGVLMFSTLTPNFAWDGAVANMVAGAMQNIFSGGKRIFNLKQKKIAFKRAFLEYLDADSKALYEINEALYYLKADDASYQVNLANLGFEEDNFIRVSNSFNTGVLGVLDVVEKENDFLYQKSKVLNSKTQKFIDFIALYKACGGKL